MLYYLVESLKLYLNKRIESVTSDLERSENPRDTHILLGKFQAYQDVLEL